MIDFLPPEAKSAVRREYVIRTVSVWAFLVGAVALVDVLLLLPTYLLLSRERAALALEIVHTGQSTSTEAYKTTRTALEKAQTLAVQLGVMDMSVMASAVLRGIRDAQTRTIIISGFSYAHTGAGVKSVEVRGNAATREALTEFVTALERNPLFAHAAVPVSDFAAAQDLPFTVTIMLARTGVKP
jgi:hypothetical protein